MVKPKRIPLQFPNQPLFGIGDQLISKKETLVIREIEEGKRGFFLKAYWYTTVPLAMKVTQKLLEEPFSEWDAAKRHGETDLYNDLKSKQYKIKRYQEACQEAKAKISVKG